MAETDVQHGQVVPVRGPLDALVSTLAELERRGRYVDLLRAVPGRACPELDGV